MMRGQLTLGLLGKLFIAAVIGIAVLVLMQQSSSISYLEQEIKRLEGTDERAKNTDDEHDSAIKTLRKEMKEFTKDAEKRAKELESIKASVQVANQRIDKENSFLKERVNTMNTSAITLHAVIDSIKSNLANSQGVMSGRLDDSEQMLDQLKDAVSSMQQQLLDLSEKFSRAQEKERERQRSPEPQNQPVILAENKVEQDKVGTALDAGFFDDKVSGTDVASATNPPGEPMSSTEQPATNPGQPQSPNQPEQTTPKSDQTTKQPTDLTPPTDQEQEEVEGDSESQAEDLKAPQTPDASAKNSDASTTNPEPSTTNPETSKTNPEASKTNPEASKTNPSSDASKTTPDSEKPTSPPSGLFWANIKDKNVADAPKLGTPKVRQNTVGHGHDHKHD